MSKEWPLEESFDGGGIGANGLKMTPDCLGREFTSRTANYDLIIGLPQFGSYLEPWVRAPTPMDLRLPRRARERQRDERPHLLGSVG
jgi:hypothetical protein